MILLVRIHIPHHLRRSPRYDTICGANRVGIPVVADGGHSEVCRGGNDRSHVPAKGNELTLSNFKKGCGGLWGLGYCESPCCSCSGNRDGGAARACRPRLLCHYSRKERLGSLEIAEQLRCRATSVDTVRTCTKAVTKSRVT